MSNFTQKTNIIIIRKLIQELNIEFSLEMNLLSVSAILQQMSAIRNEKSNCILPTDNDDIKNYKYTKMINRLKNIDSFTLAYIERRNLGFLNLIIAYIEPLIIPYTLTLDQISDIDDDFDINFNI